MRIFFYLHLFPLSLGFFYPPFSLHQCRSMIDQIDNQIYNNLEIRMKLSAFVATHKEKCNVSIEDPNREAQILNRLYLKQTLSPKMVDTIWKEIFQESKRIQEINLKS